VISKHYHIIWSQGFIEHRTKGYVNTINEAFSICESFMRSGIAVWANPDGCYWDKDCPNFSQKEIYAVLKMASNRTE
jgi:hypothetical protein